MKNITKKLFIVLSFTLIASPAYAFSLGDFFSSPLEFDEIKDYNFCYSDKKDRDSYYLSSGSFDQVLGQYAKIFGNQTAEIDGKTADEFDPNDIETISFYDNEDKYTFSLSVQDLTDGECLEVDEIVKNAKTYNHKNNYDGFVEAFDYIIGYHSMPDVFALGNVYNRYAVMKGFYLGMDKERACAKLREILEPHAGKDRDKVGEYVEENEDGVDVCKYDNLANGSTLAFKDDKLTGFVFEDASVNILYNSASIAVDELANIFANNIPWLSDGLEGTERGWATINNDYQWSFKLGYGVFGLKYIVVRSLGLNL